MNDSLYAQVYDWDNLLLAHRKASKGKRGKEPAARFEYHLEDNLIALHDEFRLKTYRPGPYDSFYIHEPKRRLISAAPFRDRVVHHALCNVVEPILERSFIDDSYANRKGKGNHPEETARVARAAFSKGNAYMTLRDELGVIYEDHTFTPLYGHL
jgi:retron-type reverse transcriptase